MLAEFPLKSYATLAPRQFAGLKGYFGRHFALQFFACLTRRALGDATPIFVIDPFGQNEMGVRVAGLLVDGEGVGQVATVDGGQFVRELASQRVALGFRQFDRQGKFDLAEQDAVGAFRFVGLPPVVEGGICCPTSTIFTHPGMLADSISATSSRSFE